MSYREFLNKLLLGNEGSSGGASSWDEISGKPSAFPPSAHTHAQADVAGLTDIAAKAHTHANKTTLDKFGETNGKPTFDGAEIGGGGDVDESRLLPALDSVPVDRSGNPLVFKAISAGMDKHTLLYCPFDADMNDHSNAGGQFVQTGQKSESIVTTEKKFGSGCLNCGSGYSFLNGPLAKPVGDVDCTIHFWANITSFTGKSPFTLLTAAIPDDSNATSNFGQAAIGCLQLYVSNDLLLLERRTSSNGHTVRIIEASVSLTTGAWNHFAITRSGNIWYLFLNGQLLGTGSDTNVASATHIRIGGDSSAMSGYVDEFLVLDYAKWITDFEPPTQPASVVIKSYEVSDKGAGAVKSVNGQLPDESGNVTVETGGAVDESRLLPENPANGDIPCFDATATVGGGNDSNTVALFHFDAEIKDEAAGNAAPISATKIGTATISTDDKKFGDGSLYFNSGRLLFPVDGSRMDTDAWVASVWFKTSSTDTTFLLNQDNDAYPEWSVITESNGLHWHVRGIGQGSNHSFPTAEWNWLAVVKDNQKHLHIYLNGAKVDTCTNNIDFTVAKFGLGGRVSTSDSRNMTGYVDEFRLQFLSSDEVAQWTGTSIAVPDAPYSKPQTVGEWGKFNKSALVQNVNGQTPDGSGVVTLPEATTSAAGLMAAADKATLTGLTARGIYPNALAKAGAVDFNEVIDHGMYFIGGDTPHLNYPETYAQNGGTLQVIRYGNTLTQMFIPINIDKEFVRSCLTASSDSSKRTFSPWRRQLTDNDITESKAQPGYFKLPGGTIVQWGSFVITANQQAQEITLPVALSSIYSKQVSGSNSSLKIGIYGGTNGKITCYVEGSTSGTVDWMVIGK